MRRLAAPISALVLALLIVWSYVHFKEYRPISTDTRLLRPPEILLAAEDVRLAGRSRGRQIWRLDAKRLTLNQSRTMTTLEGIVGGAIYVKGKPAAVVKAGRATYQSVGNYIQASGGVQIGTRDGTVLETNELSYDGVAKKLICPGKVTIRRGQSRGSSDGLVADLARNAVWGNNLRLKVEVRGDISSEPLRIAR